MKPSFFIVLVFLLGCCEKELFANDDDYMTYEFPPAGLDSCAIGLPVITSMEHSITQEYFFFHVKTGEEITKLNYYGYNPGKELSRHFKVWMVNIKYGSHDLFAGHEYPKEGLVQVFDGECTIAHGGTDKEPIALLEIPLDLPFATVYGWQCIRVESTGEAAHDVYFQLCVNPKGGMYKDGPEGKWTVTYNAALGYTITNKVIHFQGTISDQDGKSIENAKVLVSDGYEDGKEYIGTTNERGEFDVGIGRSGYYVGYVSAPGHTFLYDGIINLPDTSHVSYQLYNKLRYKAGKCYTMILPIEPDATAGKYFRLDRMEGRKAVFERELHPQANVPYVFFPFEDMQIDLSDMDLTIQAGSTQLDKIGFYGSYGMYRTYVSESTNYWSGEDPIYNGKKMFGPYLPMQGVLTWDTPDYPSGIERVFHDFDDSVTSPTDKSVNNHCFDLSGRRLNTPPTRPGLYIKDGRKVVVK